MLVKNTYHEIDITDMNDLGYGVGRIEGMVVFVDGGVDGDRLLVKLIKIAKDYAVGRLERLITPSEHRAESDCAVFPRCGGCSFRHITREHELELKRGFVISAFRKNKVDAVVDGVMTDGRIDGYRNKAQYPVSDNGDIGYYAKHSHNIIPCDNCLLTDPALSEIAAFASEYIKKNGWSVKHIYLRRGQMTGQTMLCLVVKTDNLRGEKEFACEAVKTFPEITSVLLNIHPEDTNVILGKKVRVLYGSDRIEDILCDCRFGISSLSFYQVNRGTAELLYREAIRRASEVAPKRVLDLYCGAGTIGLSFAKAFPNVSVTGVEIIPSAVENARANAKLNGIENAEFICADAMTAPLDGFDCIFIDPPRKGMSDELVKRICELSPKKLVYVSCEPSTLARDAAKLISAGYKMNSVTPADMFPRTGAVECVTDFEKTE